ncbi:MAG: penicillin acylase family protein [Caulobacteraceae bacterium]|nr:penicillin acylase family protein [Caulobacteraceae bacterium]
MLALLASACAAGLIPCAAAAQEQPRHDVMSVLAPGQGRNVVDAAAPAQPALTAQLGLYRDLPSRLGRLSAATLDQFYKPMDFAPAPPGEIERIDRPRPGVRIVRDRTYGVPRVHGRTRDDAMFGVGYAQAQSLLWQMEVNRATWHAASAALLGPGKDDENLKADALLYRVLDYTPAEYQRMYRRLDTAYGPWGRRAHRDIRAYVDGVNAYVAKVRADRTLLPAEFRDRGLEPGDWSPLDVMAATAWAQVRGQWRGLGPREAGNAILLRQLQARFGEAGGARAYADLRDDGDPETPRIIPTANRPPGFTEAPGSAALIDPGSLVVRETLVKGGAAGAAHGPDFISAPPSKSNALLVSAALSATGRPISIQGPQDGYGFPHSYDFEIEVEAPDLAARGALEFHGPYPYNGARGRNFAFSGTAQYLDQFDMFAEPLCEPDGTRPSLASNFHLYRGRCIPFTTHETTRTMPGGGRYTLRSVRSVHGPLVGRATVGGVPVALAQARSTLFHEEYGLPPLAQVFSPSRVHSARSFVEVMSHASRQLAYYYIDRRDIAFVNPGLVPLRADGMRPDLPAWGTGRWDWKGFDPVAYRFRSAPPLSLPWAINPPDQVIAGWNNTPGDLWPMADGQWIAGPGERVSLLKDPTLRLGASRKIDLADLVEIHTRAALTDLRAQSAYAIVRTLIGEAPDADSRAALEAMDRWVADGALRRDAGGRGVQDHGAAIAVFDRWWPLLVRSVFQRALGQEIIDQAGGEPNNLSSLHTGPGSISGWIGAVSKDLRNAEGQAVPGRWSRVYCGDGRIEDCRADVRKSLAQAVAETKAAYGEGYLARAFPIVCEGCVQDEFEVTGAAGKLPPIPWQNRPTFELIVGFH